MKKRLTAQEHQRSIFINGFSGIRPEIPTLFTDLQKLAEAELPAKAFAYIAGGAGDQSTMRHNREGFERLRIVPRMLKNVAERSTAVELLGRTLPVPILTAPVGALDLVHPEADIEVAKATVALGIPMIFSNQAANAMEDCTAVMGDSPRWFQLYWSKSDELVCSFLQRAEACGCEAIVVTLDTTLLGWRPLDIDYAYLPFSYGLGIGQYVSDPVFQKLVRESMATEGVATEEGFSFTRLFNFFRLLRQYKGPGSFGQHFRSKLPVAAVRKFTEIYSRPSISWSDLPFLRENTHLPIILKGILHPDDARLAIDQGVDGIIVSNHGGRQIGGAIASIDALPAVVKAVNDQIPVLMDSGIRTGSDVFKALALGAKAVCIGRPFAYGLAVGEAEGVQSVLQNIISEFELTMALAGCRTVEEIGEEMLGD